MQQEYYVSHNGQETGPYTAQQIKDKWEAKELVSQDYVYVEEKEEWLALEDFLASAPDAETDSETLDGPTPPETIPSENLETAAYGTHHQSLKDRAIREFTAPTEESILKSEEPPTSPKLERKSEVQKNVLQKKSSTTTHGNLTLDKGTGTLNVSSTTAEVITITVKDTSNSNLDITSVKQVAIKAAPAKKLHISEIAETVQAGKEIEFTVEAQDDWGNIDENYEGEVGVEFSGSASGDQKIKIRKGKGIGHVTNKVAEEVVFSLKSLGQNSLATDHQRSVLFEPGPAKRLEVVEPKEAVAGEEWTIYIRALDEFNNLATNYNGTVKIDISGTESSQAELTIENGEGFANLGKKQA
jgi:hypothetical protein